MNRLTLVGQAVRFHAGICNFKYQLRTEADSICVYFLNGKQLALVFQLAVFMEQCFLLVRQAMLKLLGRFRETMADIPIFIGVGNIVFRRIVFTVSQLVKKTHRIYLLPRFIFVPRKQNNTTERGISPAKIGKRRIFFIRRLRLYVLYLFNAVGTEAYFAVDVFG